MSGFARLSMGIRCRRGLAGKSIAAAACIAVALLTGGCAGSRSPTDLLATAQTHEHEGRQEQAVLAIEEAVRLDPEDAELHRAAGRIQADAGNPTRAVAHYEKAAILAPSDAVVWVALAEIERDRGNFADAYVAYRRATEIAPDNIWAVSGLALTADQLGFEEEARAAYERWNELSRREREAGDR